MFNNVFKEEISMFFGATSTTSAQETPTKANCRCQEYAPTAIRIHKM